VTEISVRSDAGQIRLAGVDGQALVLPELAFRGPGSYRLRWHARGRGDGPPHERHQVLVWLAEESDGAVLKLADQLGQQLTYVPPPPPPEPPLPRIEMPSTPAAAWTRTVRLQADHLQYQIVAGEGLDTEEPMLSAPNGLAELRRSHVTVICGTHYGPIALHVERHDAAPRLDEAWDEILEFSVDVAETLTVVELMGGGPELPPLVESAGTWRLRLHARGRDAGRDAQDPYGLYESHALLLWPAAPRPVQVLRTSDLFGRSWRQQTQDRSVEEIAADDLVVVGSPPPPVDEQPFESPPEDVPSWTQQDQLEWHPVRSYGADLAEAMLALDESRQREVAQFIVHRAISEARLDLVAWVPPALAALDRGAPLPPPWDDPPQLHALFWREPERPSSAVPPLPYERQQLNVPVSQQAFALPLPWIVASDDLPARRLLDVLHSALMVYGGERYGVLLDEIVAAFPELG
jgi:hypothetical protein